MVRTIIKGGYILSMDKKVGDLPKGDIFIEGDKIIKIGRTVRANDAKIIDATGMIVMPGLINAHLHTWQTGIRGIAGNWSIPEYLHHMHAQIAPRFSANDTYLGNLIGFFNQISNGATTVFDWCHNNATPAHSDAGIQGLREAGIRAVFGHGSPKPDAKKKTRHRLPTSCTPALRLKDFGKVNLRRMMLCNLAMAVLGPDFSTWEITEHDFRLAKEFDL